jgi:hypothetical protein
MSLINLRVANHGRQASLNSVEHYIILLPYRIWILSRVPD